jgi:hypothetical protein
VQFAEVPKASRTAGQSASRRKNEIVAKPSLSGLRDDAARNDKKGYEHGLCKRVEVIPDKKSR